MSLFFLYIILEKNITCHCQIISNSVISNSLFTSKPSFRVFGGFFHDILFQKSERQNTNRKTFFILFLM